MIQDQITHFHLHLEIIAADTREELIVMGGESGSGKSFNTKGLCKASHIQIK